MTNPWNLTDYEIQVADALIKVGTNVAIEAELGLTCGAVRMALHRLCNKVGASNRVQLAITWDRFRQKTQIDQMAFADSSPTTSTRI